MEIEINRIALYLAGKLPPYYKPYNKVAFIDDLIANSDKTFDDVVVDRILKYVATDEAFYSESLLRLQKYSEKLNNTLFVDFLDLLEVPEDARGTIVSWKLVEKEIQEEFEKTIGFITPFDARKESVKNIIDWIIAPHNWKIQEFDMDEEGSQILWESMREFLEQFPVYIVDLRKKKGTTQTNINVAIELWYILAHWKKCIIITDDSLPSDIHWFKYIKPWIVTAWDSDGDKTKIDMEFKEKLEKAILAKIK